ncbi:ATPase [Spirochaetia bacterium]|nr:ATPase [Spirochaetia bacterium]
MKRYALESLKAWKNSQGRKPLILWGARQVGKTWLMMEFGRTEYKSIVYLNFDADKKLQNLFGDNISPKVIIPLLENVFDKKIVPGETLLIFDEIQECQRAKDALKYFNEEAGEYHIIAAGSFLGVTAGKFPVGQVDMLWLYPMTLYEFLEAAGRENLVSLLRKLDKDLITGISSTVTELLKIYSFVGGMPSAVAAFVEHPAKFPLEAKALRRVRENQVYILESYRGDFSRHIRGTDILKVRMLWDSIPVHLAKEKKKFVYKEVKTGGRAAEFENAMDWLVNTRLVYRIARTGTPKIPLAAYQDREIFKLFVVDIGLLCAQTGIDIKTLLYPDSDIFDDFNGALTEQFVLQELKAVTGNPILYWANEKGHSEVDFIVQHENEIIPIEVKSDRRTKSKSLNVYINEYKPAHAVRTSLKNYGKENNLYSIPLYLISSVIDIIGH